MADKTLRLMNLLLALAAGLLLAATNLAAAVTIPNSAYFSGCGQNDDADIVSCKNEEFEQLDSGTAAMLAIKEDAFQISEFRPVFKAIYHRAVQTYLGVSATRMDSTSDRLRYTLPSLTEQEKAILRDHGFQQVCGSTTNYFTCPAGPGCSEGCGQTFTRFADCSSGCEYTDPLISEGELCKYNQYEACDYSVFQMQQRDAYLMEKIVADSSCTFKAATLGTVEIVENYFVCKVPAGTLSSVEQGDKLSLDFFIPRPKSAFDYLPKNPSTSDYVFFQIQSSYSGSDTPKYYWDFGDGAGTLGAPLGHRYGQPGDYNVCLTTVTEYGSDKACSTISVSRNARITASWPNRRPAFFDIMTDVKAAPTTLPLNFPAPVKDLGGLGVLVEYENLADKDIWVKFVIGYTSPTLWKINDTNMAFLFKKGEKRMEYLKLYPPPEIRILGSWRADIYLEEVVIGGNNILDTRSVNFQVIDESNPMPEKSGATFQERLGNLRYSETMLKMNLGDQSLHPVIESLQILCEFLLPQSKWKKIPIKLPATLLRGKKVLPDNVPSDCGQTFSPAYVDYVQNVIQIYEDISRSAQIAIRDEHDTQGHRIDVAWSIYSGRVNIKFDRAVIQVLVPESVKVTAISDGGQIYHNSVNGKTYLGWIINGVNKKLGPSYYPVKPVVSFWVEDTSLLSVPVEASMSLQLGPFDDYDIFSPFNFNGLDPWFYNYEEWQKTPEYSIWIPVATKNFFHAVSNDKDGLLGLGDGLPDSWEMKHFGNLNQVADGDYDNDGLTNKFEYDTGTDPKVPQFRPLLQDKVGASKTGWAYYRWLPNSMGYCSNGWLPRAAWRYGYSFYCGYAYDSANYLNSPSMSLSGSTRFHLHYSYAAELSTGDAAEIYAVFDGKPIKLLSLAGNSWQAANGVHSFAAPAGAKTLQLKFVFNSPARTSSGFLRGFSLFDLKLYGDIPQSWPSQPAPPSGPAPTQPAPTNQAPVANAGADLAVVAGSQVQLNGALSSDPEGKPLAYSWSIIAKPGGSAAALSGATAATPTFIADRAGSYTVSLTVNDGALASAADTVQVTANQPAPTPPSLPAPAPAPANKAPIANAGKDVSVTVGSQAKLDGSLSYDPEGKPLAYSWSIVAKPAGSTAALSGMTTAYPTLTPDQAGSYTIGLKVSDGALTSIQDTATVSAAAYQAPQPPASGTETVLLSDSFDAPPAAWTLGMWELGSTAQCLGAQNPGSALWFGKYGRLSFAKDGYGCHYSNGDNLALTKQVPTAGYKSAKVSFKHLTDLAPGDKLRVTYYLSGTLETMLAEFPASGKQWKSFEKTVSLNGSPYFRLKFVVTTASGATWVAGSYLDDVQVAGIK